jgi:hypothetical protein
MIPEPDTIPSPSPAEFGHPIPAQVPSHHAAPAALTHFDVLRDAEPGRPLYIHTPFWRRQWVLEAVPFATSLVFHLTLITVGVILIQKVPQMLRPAAQEQIVIPEATIIEGQEVGGLPNPGLGGDPNMAAAQNVDPSVTVSDGRWDQKSETLSQTLMGGGAAEDASDSVIGLGANRNIGSGTGIGSGSGSGQGAGSGEGGGVLAQFGVPGGGMGLGPKSPFMGISGNARNVAYVCDASGSMIEKFPVLKLQLRKAIDVLRPTQSFNVIFFSDPERKQQALGPALVPATPDIKRNAYKFLEGVSAYGITDPIPGLELAFKQKPQLIYLLTDGDFSDNAAVLKRIRDLNKDKQVKINTIVFVNIVTVEKSIVELMQQIARENGGVFKVVSANDL